MVVFSPSSLCSAPLSRKDTSFSSSETKSFSSSSLKNEGSFSEHFREPAIQALRIRAARVRRLLLRRRWTPCGKTPSQSFLSKTSQGSLPWYTQLSFPPSCEEESFSHRLGTAFLRSSLETPSLSLKGKKAKSQAGYTRALFLQNQTLLPSFEDEDSWEPQLLHKDDARFHQRFYPTGKNPFPAYGCLHVTSVANNCFIGITDIWGGSLKHGSTGSIGFSSKQRLPQPAFLLGMKMAREALQGGMKTFLLVLSGPGKGLSAAQAGILKVVQRHWKGAQKEGLYPTFKRAGTLLLKKLPHNGCRLPTQRRKRRKTKVRSLGF